MGGGTCARCRFWQRLRADADEWGTDHGYDVVDGTTGMCRRFPPVGRRPDQDTKSSHSWDAAKAAHWPVTWEDDWCGEFDAAVKVVA